MVKCYRMLTQRNLRRIGFFLLGIFWLTLGISLIAKAQLGTGAYDAINFAIAQTLNVSLTIALLVSASVAFTLASLIRKRFANPLTFVTAFLLGFGLDLWAIALNAIQLELFAIRLLSFSVGIVFVCIGVVLYLLPQLPANPLDDLTVAVSDRLGIKLGSAKLGVDGACMLIGFLLGGPVGLGTLALVICIGPGISIVQRVSTQWNLAASIASEPQTIEEIA